MTEKAFSLPCHSERSEESVFLLKIRNIKLKARGLHNNKTVGAATRPTAACGG